MRGSCVRYLTAVAVFGGLAGCATSRSTPNLRTPIPEQYALPPVDDARFSQPVSYPKETLNQEPLKPASNGKLPSQQPAIAPGGANGPGGRMSTPGGF
jgi:hypothetical protein